MLALVAVVAAIVVVLAGHLSSDKGKTSTRATTRSAAHLVRTAKPRAPHRPPSAFASAPAGRWVTESEAPTARGEVSAARVGNFAYVVGGFDARDAPAQRFNA